MIVCMWLSSLFHHHKTLEHNSKNKQTDQKLLMIVRDKRTQRHAPNLIVHCGNEIQGLEGSIGGQCWFCKASLVQLEAKCLLI